MSDQCDWIGRSTGKRCTRVALYSMSISCECGEFTFPACESHARESRLGNSTCAAAGHAVTVVALAGRAAGATS